MCTRRMNLGCFCMGFLGVLIFSPFVPNTVEDGFCHRACGEGCLCTSAKPVPWQVFTSPGDRAGLNEGARTGLARKCL
jgi:hypothetical protein